MLPCPVTNRGTGFLTLPYATARAGALLGLVGLAAMTLLANTAKDYVLEVHTSVLFSYRQTSHPVLNFPRPLAYYEL